MPPLPECARIYGLRASSSAAGAMPPDTVSTTSAPAKFKCAACRRVFSLTGGTALAATKLSLVDWLRAIDCLCTSPRGLSSAELSDTLGITRKSALLVLRRVHRARGSTALRQSWIRALHRAAKPLTGAANPEIRRQARALLEEVRAATSTPQRGWMGQGIPSSATAFRVTLWPLSPETALCGLLQAKVE